MFQKIAIFQCLFFASIATVTGKTKINGNLTRAIDTYNSSIWLIDALAPLSDGNLANNGYWYVNGQITWFIQIWNPSTGVLIRKLTGHTDAVKSLALLPDKTLASGGLDKKIRIWNPATGTLIRNISTSDVVEKLALLKDGTLASCGGYGTYDYTKKAYSFPIQIWKPSTGVLIRTLVVNTYKAPNKCSSLVSLSNETLATAFYDGSISILNIISGSLVRNMSTNLDDPRLALLADGNLACVGYNNFNRYNKFFR